jgi:RimJ/RimL family protein N-acetyltransferase
VKSNSLILEPLRVSDASEVAAALDDVELHRFIGGQPDSVDQLRSKFELQVVGHSPDGSQGWLNWVVRDAASRRVVGTVQATLSRHPEGVAADVAWTVATPWQGQGRAKEAAGAMVTWLWAHGVTEVVAHIHPEHSASIGVARSLGLSPTEEFVDGERRWHRTR